MLDSCWRQVPVQFALLVAGHLVGALIFALVQEKVSFQQINSARVHERNPHIGAPGLSTSIPQRRRLGRIIYSPRTITIVGVSNRWVRVRWLHDAHHVSRTLNEAAAVKYCDILHLTGFSMICRTLTYAACALVETSIHTDRRRKGALLDYIVLSAFTML